LSSILVITGYLSAFALSYDVYLEIGRVIINDALVRAVNFLFSRKVLDSLKRFDIKGKGVVGRPPYPNLT